MKIADRLIDRLFVWTLLLIMAALVFEMFVAGYEAMDAQLKHNEQQYADIMKGR